MKLLLDENLSRRIVPFLQGDYPGSTQVALLGMERMADREIWEYARQNNFVVVSRDSDGGGAGGAASETELSSVSFTDCERA
jgi:predicted nuclease of predicted toxin-antitoxin system